MAERVFRNKRAVQIVQTVEEQLREQGKNIKSLQPLIVQYANAYDRRLHLMDKIKRGDVDPYDKDVHKILTDYGKEQERLAKLLGLLEISELVTGTETNDIPDLW